MTTGSTEYGSLWRIEVGDGQSSEVFSVIGGELSFDWERSSKEIDTSSKDDGAYASSGYGSQAVTFSPNGVLKLPDTGLQRLVAVSKLTPPNVNIKVIKGAIVKYAGQVAVGNMSTTHPNDDKVTWKCSMKASAAPTIDDLGAAA